MSAPVLLSIAQAGYLFFIGIVFGLVYVKYKTIWAPIAMHIAFNLWSLIMFNVWNDFYSDISDTLTITLTAVSALTLGIFIFKISKIDKATNITNPEGDSN